MCGLRVRISPLASTNWSPRFSLKRVWLGFAICLAMLWAHSCGLEDYPYITAPIYLTPETNRLSFSNSTQGDYSDIFRGYELLYKIYGTETALNSDKAIIAQYSADDGGLDPSKYILNMLSNNYRSLIKSTEFPKSHIKPLINLSSSGYDRINEPISFILDFSAVTNGGELSLSVVDASDGSLLEDPFYVRRYCPINSTDEAYDGYGQLFSEINANDLIGASSDTENMGDLKDTDDDKTYYIAIYAFGFAVDGLDYYYSLPIYLGDLSITLN